MTFVKFCGLSRDEDIAVANKLGPCFVGFVFWKDSRRCVTLDKAVELSERLDPAITPVGVFYNSTLEEIGKVVSTGCIRTIQLHGGESERFVNCVQHETGLPVIRAFRVSNHQDVELAVSTEADLLMLDGGLGEGRTFDWSLLDGIDRSFILAGGLNPGNVGEAISKTHPFAVDVSSGIETDGVKDPRKMKQFMKAAETAMIA